MSLSDDDRRELEDLLDDLVMGELTAQQRTCLNELLLSNREAQRIYLDYFGLHTALVRNALAQPTAVDLEAALRSPVAPRAISPVLGFLGSVPAFLARPLVWSIALVALVSYGGFVLLAWNLRPDRLPGVANRNNVAVAVVSSAADVHWSPETTRKQNDSPIRQGESLKIDSGLVELQLKRGATLLIAGPACWSIDGDNLATLQSGNLIARVPAAAVGFTLDTPTSRIVDLGTEFSADVSESGSTEIQVLKGKVELHPGATRGESSSTQTPITLSAGDARRVKSDSNDGVRVTKIVAAPDRFTRSAAAVSLKQIRVEGAIASSTHPLLNVYDLINGSGLKEDRHSAAWEHTMWHTAHERVKQEFVLFDLFRPHRLGSMKVWNFNDASNGRSAWIGVKQADIYVATSGKGDPLSQPGEWKLVIADQQFAPGTGKDDYDTPDIVPLGDVEARYVAIVIKDAWGYGPHPPDPSPDVVGLSEVQFFGTRLDFQKPQSAPKEN